MHPIIFECIYEIHKKDYAPPAISCYNCLLGFIPFRLFAAAYLEIVCTLGTGFLISYALRTLPSMTGTVFGNLSTAISVVAGAVFLNEDLLSYQLICTLLVIVGVLGICLFTVKKDAGD